MEPSKPERALVSLNPLLYRLFGAGLRVVHINESLLFLFELPYDSLRGFDIGDQLWPVVCYKRRPCRGIAAPASALRPLSKHLLCALKPFPGLDKLLANDFQLLRHIALRCIDYAPGMLTPASPPI